ncbi:MAG: tryptophan synthase subunit alpha [bacterium]
MFRRLGDLGEIAFVPFTVLGDPNPEASLEAIRAMISGGADALELGIPFSDPVADGPTIQAADIRALSSGSTVHSAWNLISRIRTENPDLPIGLLLYANLVVHGGLEAFYHNALKAGVDSVLVADLPTLEAIPFCTAARRASIDPVLIAPPNADVQRLEIISREGRGYTYVITRRGVTGADEQVHLDHTALLDTLQRFQAPPPLFGFGISKPEHVLAAKYAGAAGVISGSAVVSRIERNLGDIDSMVKDIHDFVVEMKAATRNGGRS